ncbi:MAG: ABC transporter permease [Pseudomonadota bacterium]
MILIYETTVREMRKSHRNALIGIFNSILTTVAFIVAFQLMFSVLGLRSAPLRGEFILFMMSGIFLFLTHTKSVGAVAGADGPTSPMMQHAPMNTIIAICGAALASLYTQIVTVVVVLFVYHAAIKPIHIEDPVSAFGMFLLAWFSGCAIGMLLLALTPWAPGLVGIVKIVYQRANMIASGKMFVANTLPATAYAMFAWNPLFHIIDQSRGFVFINYVPQKTSISYPIYLCIVFIVVGLMAEFFTRRRASISWSAGR